MKTRKYQAGMGLASWILVILIVGMVTSIGLTLFTPFHEHYLMEKVLDKMSDEPGLANRTNDILLNMIRQRFKLNNVRGFDFNKNMKIVRSSKGTEIVLDYEVRENVWRNVDVVSSFKKTVLLRP